MSHNQKQIIMFAITVCVLWLMSSLSFFYSLAIMASVLFHELGHAYFVKQNGGSVKGIYMIPFIGGVCLHDGKPMSRYQNGEMLLGGPLFGIISGFMALFVALLFGSSECMSLAIGIAIINIFNLLPLANLLDGGQILSTILSCLLKEGYKWGQYISFCLLIVCVFTILKSNIAICILLLFFGYNSLNREPQFTSNRTSLTSTAFALISMYFSLLLISLTLLYLAYTLK